MCLDTTCFLCTSAPPTDTMQRMLSLNNIVTCWVWSLIMIQTQEGRADIAMFSGRSGCWHDHLLKSNDTIIQSSQQWSPAPVLYCSLSFHCFVLMPSKLFALAFKVPSLKKLDKCTFHWTVETKCSLAWSTWLTMTRPPHPPPLLPIKLNIKPETCILHSSPPQL